VLYVPAMQRAFGTVGLTVIDWGRCAVAASGVFWLRELTKLIMRARPSR
jgi:Ca2+-transporting ATPase